MATFAIAYFLIDCYEVPLITLWYLLQKQYLCMNKQLHVKWIICNY